MKRMPLVSPPPYVHVPAHILRRGAELGARAVGQSYDFLGSLAQEHPLFGKDHLPPSPQEQSLSKLFLKLHELSGKRRLRNMKQFRRP